MGARGPAPKRSTARRRRNKESKPDKVQAPAAGNVKRPNVSSHWHPIAKSWFTSLADSGQAQFFEPSDWQYARYVADVMSRSLKNPQKISAQLFAAVTSAMNDLLTTESARRRLKVEVDRHNGKRPADDDNVTELDEYRDRTADSTG